MTIAEKTKGYSQMSSGFWTKLDDGSSPYLFDGESFTLLGELGGGSAIDVLATKLTGYSVSESCGQLSAEDTILDAFAKKEKCINDLTLEINRLSQEHESIKGRLYALENVE